MATWSKRPPRKTSGAIRVSAQLYAHLRHEIDEIQVNLRQSDLTWLVHNASDVCGLATIFLATVLEMAKVEEETDGV